MNQKSYFTWTEDKKYTLAKLALRHEGYKLTDRNHQEKWETIIEKLKMKPEFAELEIQPMALKNQFSRMQKDVLKAAGISMEGANLSGLSEEPSELVTLLCNMAKEVHDKKIVGKQKKKKQKEKETAMNMTEKLALAQQGCSGGIKQEVTDEKDEGHSSKHSLEQQRLDLEKQKLQLQDKELFQRHLELEEAKKARIQTGEQMKQQGEQMMELLKLLVTRSST